jgi:hypothetical protein
MANPLPGNRSQKEPVPVSPEVPSAADADPESEETARLAYQGWQQRGSPIGTPKEDWFRAEEELKHVRKWEFEEVKIACPCNQGT